MRLENRLRLHRRRHVDAAGHVMTIRELGTLSGVDYRKICLIEQGRAVPTDDELQRLCDALNIMPEDIYDDDVLSVTKPDERAVA